MSHIAGVILHESYCRSHIAGVALGLAYPAARGIGSAKTHQIVYTYCFVGISDLMPLTGTSADQLPHRKSRSLAAA